ncbi:inositol monophosphatase [Candidatus Campbellbacteria bacterium]|nr:MAG: inositol monophosphatase [Candidatus Campbellbacteria bacterium]
MAVKAGGDVLMRYYGNVDTEFKGQGFDAASMVSRADRESEDVIVKIINANFPGHGIFGEEGTNENMSAEYVWYIDPLDGTSNFLRNIPLFGVSIGVTKDGSPVCGVLYFPALNLLVEASLGEGAYANNKQITVSERSLSQALYYSGGKYKSDHFNQIHSGLAATSGIIKIIDASSYELAQIAMGDAEIYFLDNVPHDVVAGVCIVREAGGVVTNEKGEPWTLDSKKILVTTEKLHKELLSIINKS